MLPDPSSSIITLPVTSRMSIELTRDLFEQTLRVQVDCGNAEEKENAELFAHGDLLTEPGGSRRRSCSG